MRLIFMGTPDFAVPALQALAEAKHDIRAVYCQPPKPQGRGHAIRKTPVHEAAEKLGLPVRTPKTLKGEDEAAFLKNEAPDFIVVAAYGLLLPQKILDIPRVSCVNLHASLLPRWRGAAPIQRAILAGDTESGITLMKMEAGLDTGPMARVERVAITPQTTAQSLHDALAKAGAKLIVPALEDLATGRLNFTPQPEEGVTYAAKLTKADSALDWRKSAAELERQIRALTPWPGTSFLWNEETIKVLEATLTEAHACAGTLLDAQFTVACGQGALRLKRVQRAGKSACEGEAFLRGLHLTFPQKLPLPETARPEDSSRCGGN